ncbi:hypothetical protein BC830DRAFT_1170539 [Chytriomyces sp. MP71]|nr:hypothetical protein BC830DRAFT_1170539 [Chytriomyces sp. MP71]
MLSSFQTVCPEDSETLAKPMFPVDILSLPSAKDLSDAELSEALKALNGLVSFERTVAFSFQVPKDFECSYVDAAARELYRRAIIAGKGMFSVDGTRLERLPTKKKQLEPVIRYIGTLIEPGKTHTQESLLQVINYFLPAKKASDTRSIGTGIAPTVAVTNLVAMGIMEREMGGSGLWRTTNRGHPMLLGKGILPNY